jgi:small conductance mechanosensitive channel
LDKYIDIITANALKVLVAIVVLFVGFKLINFASYVLKKAYKSRISNDAVYFLFQIGEIIVKVALIISIIAFLGIPTTSFVAILGSVGLAIGLSLQGSLSNFAGGFLILMLKPFKSGDFITGAGHSGTVEEIQIFYTKILTPDNKVITIPNSQLSNDSIINFSANKTRRLDFNLGVGHQEDIDKVKNAVMRVIERTPENLIKKELKFLSPKWMYILKKKIKIFYRKAGKSADLPAYFFTFYLL